MNPACPLPSAHQRRFAAGESLVNDVTPCLFDYGPEPDAQVARATLASDVSAQAAWGRMVARSAEGSDATFVCGFGNGYRIITHVLWAR